MSFPIYPTKKETFTQTVNSGFYDFDFEFLKTEFIKSASLALHILTYPSYTKVTPLFDHFKLIFDLVESILIYINHQIKHYEFVVTSDLTQNIPLDVVVTKFYNLPLVELKDIQKMPKSNTPVPFLIPEMWGPPLWHFLHLCSFYAYLDKNIREIYSALFINLAYCLKCGTCQENYMKKDRYMIALKMLNGDPIIECFNLHNIVNVQKEKPSGYFDWEMFEQIYKCKQTRTIRRIFSTTVTVHNDYEKKINN